MSDIIQVFPISSVHDGLKDVTLAQVFTNGAILSEENLTSALRFLLPDGYVRYTSPTGTLPNKISFISRGHVITASDITVPSSNQDLYAYIVYHKTTQQLWPFTVGSDNTTLSPVTSSPSNEVHAAYITTEECSLSDETNYELHKVILFEKGSVKDNEFNVIIDGNH